MQKGYRIHYSFVSSTSLTGDWFLKVCNYKALNEVCYFPLNSKPEKWGSSFEVGFWRIKSKQI